jgi:hypothetical protein
VDDETREQQIRIRGRSAGRNRALRILDILARIVLAVALLAASAEAIRIAIADFYFNQQTAEGFERAIGWAPGNAEYHRWLAITVLASDPVRSEREFRSAIRLNRWYADARLRLAMLLESNGRFAESEQELVGASTVDNTFLPRWSLANFYFRRENMDGFWKWARASVLMSYGDRAQIFDLAAATGETRLAERLDLKGKAVWASYLGWASAKAPAPEIKRAALEVAAAGDPLQRDALRYSVTRLLDLNEVDTALEVWNAGVKAGLAPPGDAARGRITNPKFSATPDGLGFNWAGQKPNGGIMVPETSAGGLRIRFTGDQAEVCDLLFQRVAVRPGATYRLTVRYWTRGFNRASGLLWLASAGPKELARMEDYLWDEGGGTAKLEFEAPRNSPWAMVVLRYQRPPGEVRGAGEASIESVRLEEI